MAEIVDRHPFETSAAKRTYEPAPACLACTAPLHVLAVVAREQQIIRVLPGHLHCERVSQKRRERDGALLVRLGSTDLDLAADLDGV